MDELSVAIPELKGRVRAVRSPDGDYPGIVLSFFDSNGREASACILEYSPVENAMMLRVYDPSDPDGDPAETRVMSIREGD